MDERGWIDLGKKRILSILTTYRISFQKQLEIKISEAGPYNQRVEPVLLTTALRELKEADEINVLSAPGIQMDFFAVKDYGRRGDHSRFGKVQRLYKEFDHYVKLEHYCGLYLEKVLYDTLLELDDLYHLVGRGPILNSDNKLYKPSGAEVRFFNGNEVYGNGGFDLFLVHKETSIPVGLEAKNIRNWIYPDTQEVWRLIARGCSVDCLPLMATRKFSYLTRARLFSNIGVLGFETQFQYFNPDVLKDSSSFANVVKKDGLGYADIKFVDEVPLHFNNFFKNILPENIEMYYERFLENKDILTEYAIDKKLAEKMSGSKRRSIYRDFENEFGL